MFISLLLLIASCSGKKEKVVDISDKTPQSMRDYDAPDTVEVSDSNFAELQRFQQWNASIKKIKPLERRHFLERFQPISTEKFMWYLDNEDSLEYERFVFPDSVRTKSAFFNWLDRSGMSYFGAKEAIQKEAFAILYTDTVLVRLSGAIDFKFWEEFIESQAWIVEGDHWIRQRKYGRAQWCVYKEEELKELTDL